MKLQRSSLRATSAIDAHEGAPPLVPRQHRTPHLMRDVPRLRPQAIAPALRALALLGRLLGNFGHPGLSSDREALLHPRRDQQVQGPLADLGEIAIGHLLLQEVPGLLELVAQALARRELYFVAIPAQRLHCAHRAADDRANRGATCRTLRGCG